MGVELRLALATELTRFLFGIGLVKHRLVVQKMHRVLHCGTALLLLLQSHRLLLLLI